VSSVDKKAVAAADALPASPGEVVLEAALAAFRSLELATIAGELLRSAARWTAASFGVAYAAEQGRRALTPVASTADGAEDPRYLAFLPAPPGRLAGVLGESLRVFDGLGPLRSLVGEWPGRRPQASLVLPLASSRGRLVGLVLLVLDARPEAESVARLGRLCELTRPAVDNALRMVSMLDLVIKDDTAQCFNRRYFEESLPEELARASRYRSPLSLIFLDMDNLKEVNTKYGHAMGSQTLHEVSVRVRSKIRKFDKLFRFGGDEFCIVLPETEWHGAMEVAERVRDAIAGKPFLLRELGDGKGIHMSASLGIASFPLHARTQSALIQRADRAMQRVKKTTKNAIGITEIEEQDDEG
jgi:diguanylate cyclase (GGDEF)-like protein